jgi:hypothetical protein
LTKRRKCLTIGMFDSFEASCLWWRRHCGWGLETAESTQTCPIPTPASNSKLLKSNELQNPEETSASEISTAVKLKYYPGITRPSLATMGFAARLV